MKRTLVFVLLVLVLVLVVLLVLVLVLLLSSLLRFVEMPLASRSMLFDVVTLVTLGVPCRPGPPLPPMPSYGLAVPL